MISADPSSQTAQKSQSEILASSSSFSFVSQLYFLTFFHQTCQPTLAFFPDDEFLGGLGSAPFGYFLRFLTAVNLQRCHGGMPSSAVLPVRPLMSSGSPSCSDTDRPTPQPRTPPAAAAAAAALVDDTPASGFCNRNHYPEPSQLKMIFHFPLGEFDRSEDEKKNTKIRRTLIRRFALLAAAAARKAMPNFKSTFRF